MMRGRGRLHARSRAFASVPESMAAIVPTYLLALSQNRPIRFGYRGHSQRENAFVSLIAVPCPKCRRPGGCLYRNEILTVPIFDPVTCPSFGHGGRHTCSQRHADARLSSILSAFTLRASGARRIVAGVAVGRRTPLGAAYGISQAQSCRNHAGSARRRRAAGSQAAIIAEYLDEVHGSGVPRPRLMPVDPHERIEVRRLMSWFNDKFFNEVSGPIVMERIYKRFIPVTQGGGSPETDALRAARSNIKYHLAYIGWLVRNRDPLYRRKTDLCGPGRGSAFVGGRLSGRCAVAGRRERQVVVREDQVAAVVPHAAQRHAAWSRTVGKLRQSRLLDPPALKAALEAFARTQGFDAAGVARPNAIPLAAERLRAFLDAGAHGDMAWMETKAAWRGDPGALWPQARSIVMLGINYGPELDPLAILKDRMRGGISVYARGDDYHDVVKSRLKAVGRWLIDTAGGEIKVFVDTAPVMEKPLAAAAGNGRAGNSTPTWCRANSARAVSRRHLHHARPAARRAGERSLRRLPRPASTFARRRHFRRRTGSDARRCISYLTIEHKGVIDRVLRPLIGNASMATTIAWRCVRGTNSPRPGGKRSSRRARRCVRRSLPNLRGSTRQSSARCLPRVRSSAPGAWNSCAMC